MAVVLEGKTCPYCLYVIKGGARTIVCSDCGTPHHIECWQENGSCTTFGCSGRPLDPSGLERPVLPEENVTADLTVKPCPYCGEEVRAAAIKCKHCKALIGRPEGAGEAYNGAPGQYGHASSAYFSDHVPTFDELERMMPNMQRPPEYPPTFAPRSWSWPAFLFGPLWYLAKGMWQKALVLFGIGFFTYGIASAIIAGISGHRDYMRHYNTGKQFWW